MRYLPQTANARKEMLKSVGVTSVDALFRNIPQEAFVDGLVDLPKHQGEISVERDLVAMASKNMNASDAPFLLFNVANI